MSSSATTAGLLTALLGSFWIMLVTAVSALVIKPNPFPKNIYDNVAYGPRVLGVRNKKTLDDIVENSLKGAALWDEIKNDLRKSGLALSGGQQQRLCIARTVAVEPEVILMDKPCSALDPIATQRIEELMKEAGNRRLHLWSVRMSMDTAYRVSPCNSYNPLITP